MYICHAMKKTIFIFIFLVSVLCRFNMSEAATLDAGLTADVKEMPQIRAEKISFSPMWMAMEVVLPGFCEQLRNLARFRYSRNILLASESGLKTSPGYSHHADQANLHQALTGTDIRLLYANLRN